MTALIRLRYKYFIEKFEGNMQLKVAKAFIVMIDKL
jgi:hypothetical protein